MSNNLILLLIIFICSWAWAQEQENALDLSRHPHWLKLLHYTHHQSDINSKEFFLAKDGASNPESELKATIDALNKSPEVSCRYPARRMWLEKMGMSFPAQKCPEYDVWTRGHGVKSISLIFASGFLGNPASYFGHPLLKFNFKDDRSPLDLLDTAINYGAFTPPDVGPLPYAIFGLFGGYDAGFTSADFFFHKNNYSELELRDLWEYELSLSPDQVDELVAHVWEMQNAKITYYFLSDNCAYRMGELLELIIDQKFMSKNIRFAIPSALFHKLHEYGLVKEVKLIKSRQTRMREKVLSLNQEERRQLKLISTDIDHVKSDEFLSLNEAHRSRTLEAALDYFSYRLVTDETDELKHAKRSVLQERISLPPGKTIWKDQPQRPPHETQRPILTQFGAFYSEKFGNAGSFRLRPALYDIVSPDTGRPPFSSLSIMDVELNASDERLWLKSFNLISVETLNMSKTGLKGDGGFAWRFKVGADQVNLACNTCTVPRGEVGVGKALEISKWLVIYGMIDPRIQSQYQGSGFLSLTPSLSALITVSDDFRINAVAGRRFYFNSDHTAESMYLVEGRLGSSRTWDLRVNYQEHIDRRYGVGVGFYW